MESKNDPTRRKKTILERIRKGKAGQILPRFKQDLELALEAQVALQNVLDLEVTQDLRNRFFERVKGKRDVHQEVWPEEDVRRVWDTVSHIAQRVTGKRAVLFHSFHEYFGALLLDAGEVLGRAEAVWRIVGEDLCLCTSELAGGFCLERNHYGDRDEYELTTWGAFCNRGG